MVCSSARASHLELAVTVGQGAASSAQRSLTPASLRLLRSGGVGGFGERLGVVGTELQVGLDDAAAHSRCCSGSPAVEARPRALSCGQPEFAHVGRGRFLALPLVSMFERPSATMTVGATRGIFANAGPLSPSASRVSRLPPSVRPKGSSVRPLVGYGRTRLPRHPFSENGKLTRQ